MLLNRLRKLVEQLKLQKEEFVVPEKKCPSY